MEPYIYVMRERWVIFGLEERTEDPVILRLHSCAVISYWGTERGLGELAKEGPKPNTKLLPEPSGTEINRLDVMRRIPCNKKAWQKWIQQNS